MTERPDVKTLWRNQKPEDDTVTLAHIHERAATFQKRIRRGVLIEYVASVFVVLVFGFYIWFFPGWMMKTGSALVILATLFVVWQMRRRMSAQDVPDAQRLELIAFLRTELVRQRDARTSAWLWYIAPFLPGMALMMAGRWFQTHASWRSLARDHEIIILSSAVAVLVLGSIWLLQMWVAKRLQRKIDELDAEGGK
jgi:Flp pilus assembly protein TadB